MRRQCNILYKKEEMKNYLIIFLLLTTNLVFAQETDGQDETFEIKEAKLNDNFTIRLKQITKEKYIAQKEQSEHLQHKPYDAITDVHKAQKMLRKRFKVIERKEEGADFDYSKYEITFRDKTKEHLDIEYGFIAYFPQLEILLFGGGHSTEHMFDLNNSNSLITFEENFPEYIRIGNPYRHSISPDKQLRINGFHDGQDCIHYFLEKWNKSKKQYEFINYFYSSHSSMSICYAENWYWTEKNKVIFTIFAGGKDEYFEYTEFYEIEIIEK